MREVVFPQCRGHTILIGLIDDGQFLGRCKCPLFFDMVPKFTDLKLFAIFVQLFRGLIHCNNGPYTSYKPIRFDRTTAKHKKNKGQIPKW